MVKAGIVGFLPEDKSDVWEFFKWCADLGYKAIDMDLSYAAPGEDLTESASRLRNLGLEPLTMGCPGDFELAVGRVAEIAKKPTPRESNGLRLTAPAYRKAFTKDMASIGRMTR